MSNLSQDKTHRNTISYLFESVQSSCLFYPFYGIRRPVFIIGCGRSGTTILGRTLSTHSRVVYLNEPRSLWASAYPNTDIWSSNAEKNKGKIHFDESDVSWFRTALLRRSLQRQKRINNSDVLIEKLPINNFRLRFINKMFPDALYIHIYRNGIEVAKSIEKLSNKGGWYGSNMYKWKKLAEYERTLANHQPLSDFCDDNFKKALLEWNLSVTAATTFLRSIPESRFIEFSYNSFLDDPISTVKKCLDFINLPIEQRLIDFASQKLERKSKNLNKYCPNDTELRFGGGLLIPSLDSSKGLSETM